MEFAVAVASDTDSWKHVKRAEELGFHASWFYDTQLLNPDVFICMALAAANTSKIRLGTGVLIPTNRIEPVAANAFATLNKLAPGRIDFGVGTGFTGRRTMGLKAMPLAQMGRYIERVQRLLLGETIDWDFEGLDRKIRFLNPGFGLINIDDEVPLHISAFGPKSRQLVADFQAGFINFGSGVGTLVRDLNMMKETWSTASLDAEKLRSTMFFLGAVLDGAESENNHKLMAQAAVGTAVIFHGMLDDPDASVSLPPPMDAVLDKYRELHAKYEPEDAKYLENHRGHLMFLREEEKALITPELVKATSMSGTTDELVDRLRQLADAGYDQFAVQLVQGQESALEDWADVFSKV
jgi:5,10-methylenetetrahydromethanopterin reductase